MLVSGAGAAPGPRTSRAAQKTFSALYKHVKINTNIIRLDLLLKILMNICPLELSGRCGSRSGLALKFRESTAFDCRVLEAWVQNS